MARALQQHPHDRIRWTFRREPDRSRRDRKGSWVFEVAFPDRRTLRYTSDGKLQLSRPGERSHTFYGAGAAGLVQYAGSEALNALLHSMETDQPRALIGGYQPLVRNGTYPLTHGTRADPAHLAVWDAWDRLLRSRATA